jgi:hypothetical protein
MSVIVAAVSHGAEVFFRALPPLRILIPDAVCLMAFIALAKLSARIFPIYILFVLPGTLAHELSHWCVALVTNAKPKLPSILPRRTKAGWLLGQVVFSNPRWYNTALVTLAPLMLLPLAVWFYVDEIALLPLISVWHWLALYMAIAVAYSTLPSATDIRLAWQYSALVLIAGCVIAVTAFLAVNYR